MKNYSFYNDDGKILLSGFGVDYPEGYNQELMVPFYVNPNNYYVNVLTKELIEIPERPSEDHKFNYQLKKWEISLPIEALIEKEIWKRNLLLQQSDWTQLPDVSLTEEQKGNWVTYRQQLRDITNQPGFPDNIIWPTQPT